MNKPRKIVEVLERLIIGVQEKRDSQREGIKKLEEHQTSERTDLKLKADLEESISCAEFTEGQLYELNYVLDRVWEIISEE